MILSEQVSKYYGDFQALNDVSFEIGKGEIVGFLGRNGAGKTTLMRVLTSFLPLSSGRVLIAGKNVSTDALAVRRMIGYLPETPPLYPDMRVKSYLKFAAQLKEVPSKSHTIQIDRVISECDLSKVTNKTISTLSKGYKQRVGIAQAIINEPEVLILDEPTSGLDPIQIQQVRSLIRNLECERTVLLSTHILSEIEQLAKRVLIIKNGHIVADESMDSILVDNGDVRKLLIRVMGKESVIEEAVKNTNNIKQIDIKFKDGQYFVKAMMTNRMDNYNELIGKLLASDIKILEIREIVCSLEEVFNKINKESESECS